MDPISPAARREALHEQISEAQMILRRAAAAAALKSDPLAEQLQALAICVGALTLLWQILLIEVVFRIPESAFE